MNPTVAYLIPSEEARHIEEIPDEAGFCFGRAIPEDESQAWVNKTAMDGLRALGRDPKILSESEELPTFHSMASAIDTADYGPELTVEALVYDPEAVGVVYVGWGGERDIALQLIGWRDRFFYYSLKESRPYLWLVLSDPTGQYDETGRDVARWAYNVLYDRDENFKAWLEGLGFDLTEEGEEAATWEEDEGDETTKPSTIADLRRRYNEAVERGEESFTIEGLEFLTSYAKYVLQYLDMNNIPDSDKLRDRIKPREER